MSEDQDINCYCDTSFILNYWEAYEADDFEDISLNSKPAHFEFLKDIIKSESKIERLKPLRKLVVEEESNLKLFSSVFALFEIFEKHSEWNIKAIISELFGVDRVLNIGRKELGLIIDKIAKSDSIHRDVILSALNPTDLSHILPGIGFPNIVDLPLNTSDFYRKYFIFSLLQVGSLDVLHLLAANNLGAKYFLTFDSDFDRVREIVEPNLNIEIIYNSHEIEQFLKHNVQCS